MGQLVISDVDDGLIDQLHRYADLHKYSLEALLREILAKAISSKMMEASRGTDATSNGIDALTQDKNKTLPFQFNSILSESGDAVLSSMQHVHCGLLLAELERCRALTPGQLSQSSEATIRAIRDEQ
ncbi:MAG: hypothetical protein H7839_13605 [Magnetococcus sp. YQC-5]